MGHAATLSFLVAIQNLLSKFLKRIEIRWFDKIAIGLGVIGAGDVTRCGAQDTDRNLVKSGRIADETKHLGAINSDQVQIEDDEVGQRDVIVGLLAGKKSDGRSSVVDDIGLVLKTAQTQRSFDHTNVNRIIFNNENARKIHGMLCGLAVVGVEAALRTGVNHRIEYCDANDLLPGSRDEEWA